MAMSKVIKSIKLTSELKNYYNESFHDIYIEKENVSVHFGSGRVEIIDLANAMRTGYDCCTFTFSEDEFDGFGDTAFSEFISACRAGEYKYAEGTKPGGEVFSPFKSFAKQDINLFITKPDSRAFAKAIIAGQIASITPKGKRRAENALEIACDCWRIQDGFWAYGKGGKNLRIGWYDWAVYEITLK